MRFTCCDKLLRTEILSVHRRSLVNPGVSFLNFFFPESFGFRPLVHLFVAVFSGNMAAVLAVVLLSLPCVCSQQLLVLKIHTASGENTLITPQELSELRSSQTV